MELITLPPREIIKEIIRFSTFPATRIHYLALCLVCKEWNEYIQFLISEKHRIELPELAVTWAVQDLIHLFQHVVKITKTTKGWYRYGFSFNNNDIYHEHYFYDGIEDGKCKIAVHFADNKDNILNNEINEMRKKFCSFYTSNVYLPIIVYESQIVQWLAIWLPKFIFRYNCSSFSVPIEIINMRYEVNKIYSMYIDMEYNPNCWDLSNEFSPCAFLEIIKTTPLHKFRKLLFQ